MDNISALANQLNSTEEEIRRHAISILASFPLVEIKKYLYLALGDESWRVRKEAVDTLLRNDISAESMEELVELTRSQDNAGLRNSAVEVLERLGRVAIPTLCRHASDGDHDVRKFILDIMGTIGGDECLPIMLKALNDPDSNVRAAAVENLGKIGNAQAVPSLIPLLDKTDISLCYIVLETLSKIGAPVPLSAITPLLVEPLLKKPVYDCLGSVGGSDVVPILIEGLAEQAKSVRDAAIVALDEVRERLLQVDAADSVDMELHKLVGSSILEELLTSLQQSDKCIKEHLIRLLGNIGDPRSVIPLLEYCNDEKLYRHTLLALKTIGDSASPVLRDAFHKCGEDERCTIVHLCGEIDLVDGPAIIQAGLKDMQSRVRCISLMTAGKRRVKNLIPDIAHLIYDCCHETREKAIEALCFFAGENEKAIYEIAQSLDASSVPEHRRDAVLLFSALKDQEKLFLLLKDENASVRKAAVISLAKLKSESSTGQLVMALVDEEPDVRIAAAGTLGIIGSEGVVEPLLLALKDNDPWVKCAVLKSLGSLKIKSSLPVIEQICFDEDGLVLITALEAIAEIGGSDSLGMVLKALDNPDNEVVKQAIEILSRFDDQWLDDYKDKLLCHSDWSVRSSFANALVSAKGKESLPYLTVALENESDEMVKQHLLELMERLR